MNVCKEGKSEEGSMQEEREILDKMRRRAISMKVGAGKKLRCD